MGNLAGIVLGEASAEIRSAADVALIGMGETTEDVGVVHALYLFFLWPSSARSELRRAPSFARLPPLLLSSLRLAIRSSAAAERRMVEVAGVEPASEAALAKHLRAYCTFDLVAGMPMRGLIRRHASDCTACGVQTSNPARGPAE